VSNWSDKIIVMGIGISSEQEKQIKEAILERVEESK
jgi:hypothetical protein